MDEEELANIRDSDTDLLLDCVRDPIDRLFKLSTRIRNPSSRLHSSKSNRHRQFDPDSGVDRLQAVVQLDHDYVNSVFLQYHKSRVLKTISPTEPAIIDSDSQGTDFEGQDNVWEPIRSIIAQHQTNSLNAANAFLIQRIAQANTRLRKQFAYWKKH